MLKNLLCIIAILTGACGYAVDVTDTSKPYLFNFNGKTFIRVTLTYSSEKPITIVFKAENSGFENYKIKNLPPARQTVTAVYETSITPQHNVPTLFTIRSNGAFNITKCTVEETSYQNYSPDTVKPNPLRAANQRHIQIKKDIAQAKNYSLLCGDSLTDNWRKHDSFNILKNKINAINAGFCGDRIEDLLWRIDDMKNELKNNPPSIVFFMIGTNNINLAASHDDIVKGMDNLILKIRQYAPSAKIVVFAIPPRALPYLKTPIPMVEKINREYEKLCDAENTFFFDFSNDLLTQDGKINMDLYDNDCLHFSSKGYSSVIAPYFTGAAALISAQNLPPHFMLNMKNWKKYLQNRRDAAIENNALEEYICCMTHLAALNSHYKKIFDSLEKNSTGKNSTGNDKNLKYTPELPEELLRQAAAEGIPEIAGVTP